MEGTETEETVAPKVQQNPCGGLCHPDGGGLLGIPRGRPAYAVKAAEAQPAGGLSSFLAQKLHSWNK